MKKILLIIIFFLHFCLLHGQVVLTSPMLEEYIDDFETAKQSYLLLAEKKSTNSFSQLKEQKKINNIKCSMMVVSGALLIGTSAGLFLASERMYENYLVSESTKEAISYRKKIVALDVVKTLFLVSGAVIGCSSAYYFSKTPTYSEIAQQEIFAENLKETSFVR